MTTTLRVRREGSGRKRLFSLGGIGRWAVTDETGTELATSKDLLIRDELQVDTGGRHIVAKLDGDHALWGSPDRLIAVDDLTGETVVEGKLTAVDIKRQTFRSEQWELRLASGTTVDWAYTQVGDRRLGFYAPDGRPLITFGHDPTFDTTTPGSTFRILLRMWVGAIAAGDRYLAQVDTEVIQGLVPRSEVPLLLQIGVWLERRCGSRYNTATGGAT